MPNENTPVSVTLPYIRWAAISVFLHRGMPPSKAKDEVMHAISEQTGLPNLNNESEWLPNKTPNR